MHFLFDANLPQSSVQTVIISGEYPCFINRVEELGIRAVQTRPCFSMPFPERYHADMQCLYLGREQLIVLRECRALQDRLREKGIPFIKAVNNIAANEYPYHVLLNSLVMKRHIFCNKKYADPKILEVCEKNSIEIITVRQGYARCSAAVISENALVTADESIYRSAVKLGYDVLKIQEGHIKLPGFSHGFIGGCCALLESGQLFFTGDITQHPDYDVIKNFARNHGVYLNSLDKCELTDIGGMVLLTEKEE
ncbi:MAG: hypothetical protein U0I48_08600 [Acutalibacteraceae bacterium]|nr:hypothetical protein [Acutalibacteraceae bacterium]